MTRRGRKAGLLYPQIERRIQNTVRSYPGASTHEVAVKAKVSWSTANKYLRKLRSKKKVRSRKVGRKVIWF